jgi:hypothetical protein
MLSVSIHTSAERGGEEEAYFQVYSYCTYLQAPDAGGVEEEGVGLAHLPHVSHVPDVEGVVVVDHGHSGVLLVIAAVQGNTI